MKAECLMSTQPPQQATRKARHREEKTNGQEKTLTPSWNPTMQIMETTAQPQWTGMILPPHRMPILTKKGISKNLYRTGVTPTCVGIVRLSTASTTNAAAAVNSTAITTAQGIMPDVVRYNFTYNIAD
mmetsp:Transcript_52264/g.126349  ORF Transcript_52264/g.126349 Transcript_52264/m.126349 type:complete len:128 (+) Transcript_52264:1643-2026(+)